MVKVARHRGARAGLGAIIKVRRIYWDFHNVLTGGHENLVYLAGANRPDVVERASLIGTIEEFGRPVGIAVERLIFEVGVVREPEPQSLLVIDVHVDGSCIFALVDGVQFSGKPVAAAK